MTGEPHPMMIGHWKTLSGFAHQIPDIVYCPTFNLGSFNVTVTTYRHLLPTVSPHTYKHPVMIDPLFICIYVKKDFSAYVPLFCIVTCRQAYLVYIAMEQMVKSCTSSCISAIFNQAIHFSALERILSVNFNCS